MRKCFGDAQSSVRLSWGAAVLRERGRSQGFERKKAEQMGEIVMVCVVIWCNDEVMAYWRDVKGWLLRWTLTPQCWLALAAAGIALGQLVPSRSDAPSAELATAGSLYLEVLASGQVASRRGLEILPLPRG